MRVHTKIELVWSDADMKYVQVSEEGYDYSGHVELCKGASTAQNNLANSQTSFYNQLTSDYGTQFANQSAILQSLNSALAPTVAAGASQFGYSPGQTNALNSTAIQGTAQQYQNAQKTLQNQQATQGGRNADLPSGVSAEQNATLAATGANQTSSELLGIQNAGYAQGNANYNTALNALGGVASQYNPASYAGQATGAGNSAASETNLIQQENQAASPLGILGGVLGGVAGLAGSALGVPGLGGLFSGGANAGANGANTGASSVNNGVYVPQ